MKDDRCFLSKRGRRMILETERLYLRELKPEDFDRLHAIFSDEETMRFIRGIRNKLTGDPSGLV
jgi:RimJ/RimL family protein N-acetyltransferase